MNPLQSASENHQTPTTHRLDHEKKEAIRRAPPVNLNVFEAAAYANCSVRKMRDLLAERRIKHARIGKRIIVRREAIDEFLSVAA